MNPEFAEEKIILRTGSPFLIDKTIIKWTIYRGYFDMSQEDVDKLTVTRLFVFLKENLNFDFLQDEFITRKLVSIEQEYVFGKQDFYRCERFLKLLIKKNICKEFIACMRDLDTQRHVYEKILKLQRQLADTAFNVADSKPKVNVNDNLLQNHFKLLHVLDKLEPHEIADHMFQAGHFSTSDHDDVTELPTKCKRLKSFLEILNRKNLYASCMDVLKSCQYTSMMETNRQYELEPSPDALCIQQNFSFLITELPDITLDLMDNVLTPTNLTDIRKFESIFRKKAKLLKIILAHRGYACEELFKIISICFKGDFMIKAMKKKSADMAERGKPDLLPSLRCLTTQCVSNQETFLLDNMEPISISDRLFEERAVDISAHDKITEASYRRKQIKILLEIVKENKSDSFHFFLFILQEAYKTICDELKKPSLPNGRKNIINKTRSVKIEAARVQGDVHNETIKVCLLVRCRNGPRLEHDIRQAFCSNDPDILKEVIAHGQMDFDGVSDGSVVLQLRPVTDDAVKTLLNAKENNRLLEMIFGILKSTNIDKNIATEKSCQIRVQVFYAKSAASMSRSGISRTTRIKHLLRIYRNELLLELEPTQIISALSRAKAFQGSQLHSICASGSCSKRIKDILSLVEGGNTDVVESFVVTLKSLGYRDIVDLIDPPDVHTEAESIRKFITSNYKNILDEMQMTLAKETLLKCIGNVDQIRNTISQIDKSRQQRMNDFLRFIVQQDHNVIEFARVLKNNGLEDLLRFNNDDLRENIPVEDIEITVVDDFFPPSSEGVLLDSVISLAYGDKADHTVPWAEHIESEDLDNLFGSFFIKIPEDPDNLSFAKDILGELKLANLVEEMRNLARSVVLYKYLGDEAEKPGTIYVSEVIAKYEKNHVVIEEKDAEQTIEFFQKDNQNLVKVMLITGGLLRPLETKKKVYRKYKEIYDIQRFYLQHESEQYSEVAKLSAHQKVVSYKQYVESVRESIPLENIEEIVKDAVNLALSKETITALCFDTVIQDSGNTNSDPYVCRSSLTVERLKKELVDKTLVSVSKNMSLKIGAEIQRHIEAEIQSKLNIGPGWIQKVLYVPPQLWLGVGGALIISLINPYFGAMLAIYTVYNTILNFNVDVNSRSWRTGVANEIYKHIFKNKEEVVREVSSNIRKRCEITVDHLKNIAGFLEDFRSGIHFNDTHTRLWEDS